MPVCRCSSRDTIVSASGAIEETEDREEALIVYAGLRNWMRTREGDGNTYNLIHIDGFDIEVQVMRSVPGTGMRSAYITILLWRRWLGVIARG